MKSRWYAAAALAAGTMSIAVAHTIGPAPPTKAVLTAAQAGVQATYHGKAVAPGQVLRTLPRQGKGCGVWADTVGVSSPKGVDGGVDVAVNKACQVVVKDITAAPTVTLAACGPAQYSGDVVQLSSGITMAQVTSFQKYYWNCGNLLTYDTTWASCYAFGVTYQVSPCQDWFSWFYSTAPSSADSYGQGFVVYSPGFGGGASGWIWVNFEVVASTWRLYASCGWNNSMGDYFHCGIH